MKKTVVRIRKLINRESRSIKIQNQKISVMTPVEQRTIKSKHWNNFVKVEFKNVPPSK